MIERALRYARTARHLRAGQLLAFVAARVRPRGRAPSPRPIEPSPMFGALANEMREWGYPWDVAREERLIDDLGAARFSFAGDTRDFARIDWRALGAHPLWTYELHYLEPLEALAWRGGAGSAGAARDLMRQWEERASRGVGWDPYPISMRSAHWATALLLLNSNIPADAFAHALSSLYGQLTTLARRPERHLLGNHLLANRAALARGSLLFADEPVVWRIEAHDAYHDELAAQVGPEGLHEERTPMYHALALRSALEYTLLRRASGAKVPTVDMERLDRMLRADSLLRRTDGSVRLINDTTQHGTPSRAYLERLGARLMGEVPHVQSGVFTMRDAGFAGYRSADVSCVVDVGEASPEWQPGHSHCSALSFELDLEGRPVICDSGLHGYAGDKFREYVRSTRAHNTISIQGREQGEVWGAFRMGRRWSVREAHALSVGSGTFAFRAVAAPFWSSQVRHMRDVKLAERSFSVSDTVHAAEGCHAESFVHVHPSCTVAVDGNGAIIHRDGREVARIDFTGVDRVTAVRGSENPVQGWFCPDFGVSEAATALIARVESLSAAHALGYTIRWP